MANILDKVAEKLSTLQINRGCIFGYQARSSPETNEKRSTQSPWLKDMNGKNNPSPYVNRYTHPPSGDENGRFETERLFTRRSSLPNLPPFEPQPSSSLDDKVPSLQSRPLHYSRSFDQIFTRTRSVESIAEERLERQRGRLRRENRSRSPLIEDRIQRSMRDIRSRSPLFGTGVERQGN